MASIMSKKSADYQPLETDHRPWGHYDVLLDSSYCKIKQITVNPGQRLSYQRHHKREEYWTIVLGHAVVTLNGDLHHLKDGDTIHIPKESWHRIANLSKDPLVFIEIQRGEYFGEDDIIRSEDDYGRQ